MLESRISGPDGDQPCASAGSRVKEPSPPSIPVLPNEIISSVVIRVLSNAFFNLCVVRAVPPAKSTLRRRNSNTWDRHSVLTLSSVCFSFRQLVRDVTRKLFDIRPDDDIWVIHLYAKLDFFLALSLSSSNYPIPRHVSRCRNPNLNSNTYSNHIVPGRRHATTYPYPWTHSLYNPNLNPGLSPVAFYKYARGTPLFEAYALYFIAMTMKKSTTWSDPCSTSTPSSSTSPSVSTSDHPALPAPNTNTTSDPARIRAATEGQTELEFMYATPPHLTRRKAILYPLRVALDRLETVSPPGAGARLREVLTREIEVVSRGGE